MITLYITYKDGSEEYIDCDQVTKTPMGTVIILKDKKEDRIPAEKIYCFGVWSK